jgi:hypothetical protein
MYVHTYCVKQKCGRAYGEDYQRDGAAPPFPEAVVASGQNCREQDFLEIFRVSQIALNLGDQPCTL